MADRTHDVTCQPRGSLVDVDTLAAAAREAIRRDAWVRFAAGFGNAEGSGECSTEQHVEFATKWADTMLAEFDARWMQRSVGE